VSPNARQFLNYEFATLSLVAGLATRNPRAPVYRKDASEEDKQRTKDWLRRELKTLAEQYHVSDVEESKHIENIVKFAEAATRSLGGRLFDGRLRFGVAQKVVNLYLKYLWVTDYVAEPPHCPIDGRIALKAKLAYQWTTSDSRAEYEEAVAGLRAGSCKESIAGWELREFEVGRQ
jgi:hypothetical protein